jgi:hypothetical protein
MSGQVSDVLRPSVAVLVNGVGELFIGKPSKRLRGWDRQNDDTLIERSAAVERDFGDAEDVVVDRSLKRQ